MRPHGCVARAPDNGEVMFICERLAFIIVYCGIFIGNITPLWAGGITVDYLSTTIDSGVEKEVGVTRGACADSLENNISEDNCFQPSLKDYYAIK